jgi:hypothetical protein
VHASAATHATARDSYRKYLDGMPFVSGENLEMRTMAKATVPDWLARNRRAWARWAAGRNDAPSHGLSLPALRTAPSLPAAAPVAPSGESPAA